MRVRRRSGEEEAEIKEDTGGEKNGHRVQRFTEKDG